MKNIHYYIFILLFLILEFSCQKDTSPVAYEETITSEVGDLSLYTFSIDSTWQIGNPKALKLSKDTKITDALDTIGKYLSETYFYKIEIYTTIITNIKFEIIKVQEIQTPLRPFRIATINLIDPEELCMGYFFQGSSGGYFTASMLTANFTQPHLATPLLDGLIILYNGQILPRMDHINLERILVPGDMRITIK